jgi:hypothetical protein
MGSTRKSFCYFSSAIGVCSFSSQISSGVCQNEISKADLLTGREVMGLQNEKIAASSYVTSNLNYLAPTEGRPRTYTFEPPAGEPRSNVVPEPHDVPIHDARASGESFSLDRRRRLLRRGERQVGVLSGGREAAKGGHRRRPCFIFDHTVRKRVDGVADRDGGPRQPVARVHVDHTENSGPQRVRDLIPDEAEELLKGRVQIINLWRPIRGPLKDSPLAVADARTVRPDELIGSDLVYPHRVGETYSVKFSPEHQWYYVSDMVPDEILLLKCFDSKTDDVARFAPHTAFIDPTAPADAAPRESIELRALVFNAK